MRTGDTNHHNGDLSRNRRHIGDFDFVSILLSIPPRKKVQDNFNCLFPYETMIRLVKGTRNNLTMTTPLFTFTRKNVGSEESEWLVEGKGFGESIMMGGDLLSRRQGERETTVRTWSRERTLITFGSAVCKTTLTDGQNATEAKISPQNSLNAAVNRYHSVSII